MKNWERFEIKVATALEQAGWQCVRSCYITDRSSNKITSQIDIIAISNYGVLSVECKSHTLDVLMKANYENKLIGYKDNRQVFKEDVLTQSKNHADQVYLSGILLEERLGKLFARPQHAIVFDYIGKIIRIRKDFSNHILDIRDLTDINIKSKLNLFKVYDDNEVNIITEHFQQFSDTSESRLAQHIDYIKHCMETKTGMWSSSNDYYVSLD